MHGARDQTFSASWTPTTGGIPILSPSSSPSWSATLRSANARDRTEAWQTRRRGAVRTMLALAEHVPDAEALRDQWSRRLAFQWPAWRPAAGLWDALPPTARQALKQSPARNRESETASA